MLCRDAEQLFNRSDLESDCKICEPSRKLLKYFPNNITINSHYQLDAVEIIQLEKTDIHNIYFLHLFSIRVYPHPWWSVRPNERIWWILFKLAASPGHFAIRSGCHLCACLEYWLDHLVWSRIIRLFWIPLLHPHSRILRNQSDPGTQSHDSLQNGIQLFFELRTPLSLSRDTSFIPSINTYWNLIFLCVSFI